MIRLAAALLALTLALPAAAQDAEIEQVIDRQIAAFQANDLETAFGFAAPGIRQKFGSPETFGQMVERGYPMIWRPSRYEHGALTPAGEGEFVKTVTFQDATGALFEADYLMGQTEGAWRIRGVSLRRLPGIAS